MLGQLGRHREATAQHEKAVAAELARGASDGDAGVKVARHFLASHLTKQGEPARALEVLAPSIHALPDDWLLRATEAAALFALHRLPEAREAAEIALAHAPSEAKGRRSPNSWAPCWPRERTRPAAERPRTGWSTQLIHRFCSSSNAARA